MTKRFNTVLALTAMLAVPTGMAGSGSSGEPARPTVSVGPAINPAKAVPYTMTGVVKDAQGKPLEGVQVLASNTLYSGSVVGYTDANGRYSLKLPQLIGTWAPVTRITRTSSGQAHELPLFPLNTQTFAGSEGAVRDFVWKISGKTPTGGSYGASLWVNRSFSGEDFEVSRLELELVPVSLADGSKGRALTVRYDNGAIPDVPLGRFTVTATYRPESGPPRRMLVRQRGDKTYREAATVEFQYIAGMGLIYSLEAELPAKP